MLDILQQGGMTVIPLVICSIISVAVSLERLVYLKRAQGNNFRLIKRVKLALNNNKIREAKKLVKEERGPVAAILLEGIKYVGKRKYEIWDNLELVGKNEVKKLEKRLRVLEFVASVSPLLGLLGTVLGIIDSFNILAGAQGLASPSQLSGGIGQALISTAVGLIVAIPTMMMYSYLVSLVEKRTAEINKWYADIVDVLSQVGKNV